MIIGNGDIASILNDREGAIFFASGVSNSLERNEDAYMRELNLLNKQDKKKCLFYFSTISIDDINKQSSRYIMHKKWMENIVKFNFKNYNIIRIGNIDWGNNPHTFINNIRTKISKGENVQINDEYKFIINKEELLLLTDNLPLVGQNQISVFGKMMKVIDII